MAPENNCCLFILAIFWTLHSKGYCVIVFGPADTQVIVGDSAYFNCSISESSEEISWYHYPVGKNTMHDFRYVYVDEKMHKPYDERFRIEKDNRSNVFKLVITKAEVEDAGRYICQTVGEEQSEKAELVVIKSDSTCGCWSNINASGLIGPNSCGIPEEKIELTFQVSYVGNISPLILCEIKKGKKSSPIGVSCNKTDGRLTCNYTSSAVPQLDGSSFSCQADSNYGCQTKTVRILQAISAETILRKTIGDVVTCPTNANFEDCIYSWIWEDLETFHFVSLTKSAVLNLVGLYKCVASCRIKDFQCCYTPMLVNVSAPTPTPAQKEVSLETHNFLIGSCIGTLVATIIVVFIQIMIKRIDRKKRDKIWESEIEKRLSEIIKTYQDGEQ